MIRSVSSVRSSLHSTFFPMLNVWDWPEPGPYQLFIAARSVFCLIPGSFTGEISGIFWSRKRWTLQGTSRPCAVQGQAWLIPCISVQIFITPASSSTPRSHFIPDRDDLSHKWWTLTGCQYLWCPGPGYCSLLFIWSWNKWSQHTRSVQRLQHW